jgi:hypothetical protein
LSLVDWIVVIAFLDLSLYVAVRLVTWLDCLRPWLQDCSGPTTGTLVPRLQRAHWEGPSSVALRRRSTVQGT